MREREERDSKRIRSQVSGDDPKFEVLLCLTSTSNCHHVNLGRGPSPCTIRESLMNGLSTRAGSHITTDNV